VHFVRKNQNSKLISETIYVYSIYFVKVSVELQNYVKEV